MFAIVKDGAITQTAPTVKEMFTYSVPEGAGFNHMSDFMKDKGVIEVVKAEMKNQTYYFVTPGDITLVDGIPTQQYTNIPRLLADEEDKDEDGNNRLDHEGNKVITQGLKTTMTEQVKQKANTDLSRTDWMVIRKAERDVAIPSATATYRAAVITECARLEAAIAGAADVDALEVVMNAQNWPTEP